MSLPDADAIRRLGIPALTGEDDLLDTLVVAADAHLARWCLFPATATGRRTLDSASYVQYYSKPDPDPRRLTLGLRPVLAAGFELALDDQGDLTYATVADDDDVVLDTDRGLVWVHPLSTLSMVAGLRSIRVSCTAGWDVSAEPPLVQALAFLCAHWLAVGQAGTFVSNATVQGTSGSFRDPRMPGIVSELASPYRLWERETHFRGQP